MSKSFFKSCPDCGEPVHVRTKVCSGCSRTIHGEGLVGPEVVLSPRVLGWEGREKRPLGTSAAKMGLG